MQGIEESTNPNLLYRVMRNRGMSLGGPKVPRANVPGNTYSTKGMMQPVEFMNKGGLAGKGDTRPPGFPVHAIIFLPQYNKGNFSAQDVSNKTGVSKMQQGGMAGDPTRGKAGDPTHDVKLQDPQYNQANYSPQDLREALRLKQDNNTHYSSGYKNVRPYPWVVQLATGGMPTPGGIPFLVPPPSPSPMPFAQPPFDKASATPPLGQPPPRVPPGQPPPPSPVPPGVQPPPTDPNQRWWSPPVSLARGGTPRKNFKPTTGAVQGGSGNVDDVPAMLTGPTPDGSKPGEYVLNQGAVMNLGLDFLQHQNLRGLATLNILGGVPSQPQTPDQGSTQNMALGGSPGIRYA